MNKPNPAQQASEEYKLHVAICNAVILLNNGEEIAPRVSAILREALFNYTETPARELTAAQGVPDGWVLVPREPTDAMVRATTRIDLSYMPGQEAADREAIYRAMIAVAPATLSQPIEPQGAVVGSPERIVLGSRGVEPNWWLVAERSKRPDVNGMPVYETLDQINNASEAALPVAVGAGEDAARGRFLISLMAFENDSDPESGQWYSHAYLKAEAIRAPVGSPYFKSVEEIVDAAMTPATPAGKGQS